LREVVLRNGEFVHINLDNVIDKCEELLTNFEKRIETL